MGYDLHITRKASWSDDEDKNVISLKEWKEYVSKNSNIYEDPENDEYSFLHVDKNEDWPLWYWKECGNIHTKNPEKETVIAMVKIAKDLNARVVGDDDEEYDDSGNPILEERVIPEYSIKKPWWKFW